MVTRWRHGAPALHSLEAACSRFDFQAEELANRAAALRRAGLIAGGEVQCDIRSIVDFFEQYITQWNPNKTEAGEEKASHVAEQVNETQEHTAAMSVEDLLDMLRSENPHARVAYYERAVRTEHLHDFHYPDLLGPLTHPSHVPSY